MDDVIFLFDGWAPVARVVFITATGYVALLLILRAAGTRTLALMKPFDFVVTVTLGSAFGRVITAQEVAIVEVVVAFTMLAALQLGVAHLHQRSAFVRRLTTPDPTLLYHEGEVVRQGLRRHRIREADLDAVVRKHGMGSLEDVRAIVLEADGTFVVIPDAGFGDGSAVPLPRPA